MAGVTRRYNGTEAVSVLGDREVRIQAEQLGLLPDPLASPAAELAGLLAALLVSSWTLLWRELRPE